MDLKEKIRELADARGTTFHKIEDLCGLGNGSIRKWVGNKFPSADRLYRVANFLGTTTDDLVRWCLDESDS